jgi:hypothetical protein
MRGEWKNHWQYYLCQFAALCWIGWWFSAYERLPLPGYAVAIVAVLAALMSVHSNIQPRHKFIYFLLMGALLFIEFRAIKKDKDEAQEAQKQLNTQENERIKTLLEGERNNTKTLLDQENASLSAVLKQDQTQFENTISTLLTSHRQDEKAFASVMQKEESLIEEQKDFSEQFMGRLVPGNSPTPKTICSPNGQNPKDGQMLVSFNDIGWILEKFPQAIWQAENVRIIQVDRVENSDAIVVSLDFRDSQNQIAFRIDKDGVVNRSGYILLHPNKSTFLIQDSYGKEIMRATFVNPKVFVVKGEAIYCGNITRLPVKNICFISSADIDFYDTRSRCPMPKQ